MADQEKRYAMIYSPLLCFWLCAVEGCPEKGDDTDDHKANTRAALAHASTSDHGVRIVTSKEVLAIPVTDQAGLTILRT